MWSHVEGQEEYEGTGGHLGLQDTVDKLAKANGVRWYGHVLRRDEGKVLRRVWTSK